MEESSYHLRKESISSMTILKKEDSIKQKMMSHYIKHFQKKLSFQIKKLLKIKKELSKLMSTMLKLKMITFATVKRNTQKEK